MDPIYILFVTFLSFFFEKLISCFISLLDWRGAFCGNKIVEDGEECDCGYDDDECEEKCCYPRVVSETDKALNPAAQGCKRRPSMNNSTKMSNDSKASRSVSSFYMWLVASWQERSAVRAKGSAATGAVTLCRSLPSSNARKRVSAMAKPSAMGTWPNVPRRPIILMEPNATATLRSVWKSAYVLVTLSYTRPSSSPNQVCQNGECSGSICSKFGMKDCFLTSSVIDDKRKLCELACQIGNDNTTCKGTSELSAITKLPTGISLRPGSPCDNYQVLFAFVEWEERGSNFNIVLPISSGVLWRLPQMSSGRCRRSSRPFEKFTFQSGNAAHHRSMDNGELRSTLMICKSRCDTEFMLICRSHHFRNTGGPYCWWGWPSCCSWAYSSNAAPCTHLHLTPRSLQLWASRRHCVIHIARSGGNGIIRGKDSSQLHQPHTSLLLTTRDLQVHLMANRGTSIPDPKVRYQQFL